VNTSENCLLIDKNSWNTFIGIFNTTSQSTNEIGVTISHKPADAVVTYCGENPTIKPTSDVPITTGTPVVLSP
jgi:hypothetical protein